jgi:2-polyprenyl-3-methyl-5-hydroxy-6-metoxy-1,4-benzoquinol methylase
MAATDPDPDDLTDDQLDPRAAASATWRSPTSGTIPDPSYGAPALETVRPRTAETVKRVGGGRVLNIGCVGQGATVDSPDWLHGLLAERVDELIGVDIQRVGVENLQQAGWDVRHDDATELATVSGPVDTVVAGEVIEHLAAPGEMLAAVKEVLAPDGRLILTTPNPWAAVYLRRVCSGGEPVGNDEHTCWFDATTLRQLTERYGFGGEITHIKPSAGGLSALVYRAHRKLGGTRLLADLEVSPT